MQLEIKIINNCIIFGIKQIKEKILNDNDTLLRIIFWLFNKYNPDKFEYIQMH